MPECPRADDPSLYDMSATKDIPIRIPHALPDRNAAIYEIQAGMARQSFERIQEEI